jgi:predicted  nucleic acid-binding Zn-ribbon protein
MTMTGDVLRELHRIHQQLSDLRERLERGPQQVRARAANVTRLEEELAKVQADSKAAHMAADRKQLLLRSGETKIEDLQRKLNAASSNREYQALKDQIAADQMANSVLADEILEALEKVDECQGKIVAAQQNLSKSKAELEKAQQQVRDRQESLQADVARLETELKRAEKSLPADFRDAYERVVKSKGADAMAALEGENCSGCFHQMTANMVNAVRMDRVVFCHTCGRLLYLPEDRSIGGGRE